MTDLQETAESLYRLNQRVFFNHCFYCGILVDTQRSQIRPHIDHRINRKRRTRDHIAPAGKGNSWYAKHPHGGLVINWVTACRFCNSCKGALDIDDWRLVFFGGHGGKFWGERFLEDPDCVRFLDMGTDYKKILPPIPEAS